MIDVSKRVDEIVNGDVAFPKQPNRTTLPMPGIDIAQEGKDFSVQTIMILGLLYQIIYVDEIHINKNGDETLGEIDFLKQVIKIKKGMSKDKSNIVLIHEVLHGILEQLGFECENNDEHLLNSLSTTLYVTFANSIDLFR